MTVTKAVKIIKGELKCAECHKAIDESVAIKHKPKKKPAIYFHLECWKDNKLRGR